MPHTLRAQSGSNVAVLSTVQRDYTPRGKNPTKIVKKPLIYPSYAAYLVYKVAETIKVSKGTKQSLVRIAATLQERSGRRVDLDEAIRHLVSLSEEKKKSPELLDKVFGSVPGLKVQDLYKERRLDERRVERKHRIRHRAPN